MSSKNSVEGIFKESIDKLNSILMYLDHQLGTVSLTKEEIESLGGVKNEVEPAHKILEVSDKKPQKKEKKRKIRKKKKNTKKRKKKNMKKKKKKKRRGKRKVKKKRKKKKLKVKNMIKKKKKKKVEKKETKKQWTPKTSSNYVI